MSDLNEIIEKLKLLTCELEAIAQPADPYEGARVHFPDINSGFSVVKIEEERVDASIMGRTHSVLGAFKVSFQGSHATLEDFEKARTAFIIRDGKVTSRGKCQVYQSITPLSREPCTFVMRMFPELT